VDCADYRIDCDGDTDGDGNDLLHGVLNKKTVLWKIVQNTVFG
jgi:hypothetical protein